MIILEIINLGCSYEVWDYNRNVCFEGSFADFEDYISCCEEDEENEND
jgi:hypothetical protein